MHTRALVCVLALIGAAAATARSAPPDPVESVTEARHDLQLGLSVGGTVASTAVEPGDRIEAGQTLLELEHGPQEAEVRLRRLRAETDVPLRSARKRKELKALEHRRLKNLLEKDAASPIEVQRARLEKEVAALEVERAQEEHKQAQAQLRRAEARRDQYTLTAPRAGVLNRLKIAPGETVEPLETVAHLVVIDPLRIEAQLPLAQSLELDVTDPVWVVHGLPGDRAPAKGKIVHIAPAADAASGTRLVRVEVPNPKKIPAGGEVTVHFQEPESTKADAEKIHR